MTVLPGGSADDEGSEGGQDEESGVEAGHIAESVLGVWEVVNGDGCSSSDSLSDVSCLVTFSFLARGARSSWPMSAGERGH